MSAVTYITKYCPDLKLVRHFYTTILKFEEESYGEQDGFGWLTVRGLNGIRLNFFTGGENKSEVRFAYLPGSNLGEYPGEVYSIKVTREHFQEAILKFEEHNTPMLFPTPKLSDNNYWFVSVLDPLGTTIELYYIPKPSK